MMRVRAVSTFGLEYPYYRRHILKCTIERRILFNKARTGPRSAVRFKPEVQPRSKLKKCPEEEEHQQLK